MLRDSLFDLLAQRLGNRQDLVSRMATEVQLLQDVKLEQNYWLPWFLETEMAYTATTAGEERVELPADFLGEVEEQALWLYDSTASLQYKALRKMEYDDMIVKYPGTGTPEAYAIGANYLFVRSIPDAVYTLKMRYLARDAVLDSNIENQWLKYASDLVMAELGAVMAKQHMQYMELAATFENDAKLAWDRLYKAHIARQEANIERVMEV
jgi:hypothetical protein